MSVLIKNGTIVTTEQSWRADLYCEKGVLEEIGENLNVREDARVIMAVF